MINNVVLQGKLGQDFDLKYTQSGKAVATTSIAVKKNFADSQGNYGVDWINIVFWGKQAETVANHFMKGNEILVTGSIQSRNYENQQGERKYITEIVCQSFSFPGGNNSLNSSQSSHNRNTGGQNNFEDNSSYGNQNGSNRTSGGQNDMSGFKRDSDPFGGSGYQSDQSDGLPF
ncbi:single-stranded DNA-binding protein [Enterococcus sp. LJL99]